MPTVAPTPEDLARAQRLIELELGMRALRQRRPWDWYQPHAKQLAFHRAPHRIRALFPGNRFGKTSAAAMEAQWFCTRTHPHRRNPKHPGDVIWACPSFDQFEILLPRLRELVWGPVPKYSQSQHTVTFPNGGRIWAWSRERDWTTLKGINPAAIIFDEDALEALWNESKARGYGEEDMSVIITNTPTEAMGTWMETEVYQPWLDHHTAGGLNEDEANARQTHPKVFCLTRGGIADNPSLAHRVEEFRAEKFRGGRAEWEVRNYGGFRYIGTTGVFDPETLGRVDELITTAAEAFGRGTTGFLHPIDRKVAGVQGMLRLPLSAIKDKRFIFGKEPPGEHGRITVWEQPRKGRQYTLGFDAAYGLEDGDWDAIQVVDATAMPPRQVAAAWGHWGNKLARIVYPLARWYNEAFIMGERQVGLLTLQTLADELEYDGLYRQRHMDTKAKQATMRLGWPRVGNDITLQHLRDALDYNELLVRCPDTLREMQRMVWERPEATAVGAKRDAKVRGVILRGGGSPDKVVALCYALQAIAELAKEPAAKRRKPTHGWQGGLPDLEEPEDDGDAVEGMLE